MSLPSLIHLRKCDGRKTDDSAIFVTWNTTRPGHEPRLRGCIGTFTPMPLAEGLKEYALIRYVGHYPIHIDPTTLSIVNPIGEPLSHNTNRPRIELTNSALKDHRFHPISATELPTLQCGISILTPTTPISDPLAWTPGIHGIQISFPSPSTSSSSGRTRRLSATYLPEIATDQGWSQEETILSAIQKAGYRGRVVVGDEVWRSLEVGVYESSKAKLDWAEYEAWRAGRD
jgi:AMMECR1 domain-containing protein